MSPLTEHLISSLGHNERTQTISILKLMQPNQFLFTFFDISKSFKAIKYDSINYNVLINILCVYL
ncbi:hypothetical protein BLOT_004041 [Blomia tropicalis]|nr:hypothetical protein BLOT_004041 [Blomia tropicalis]